MSQHSNLLEIDESDDQNFIEIINLVLIKYLQKQLFEDVFIVKIKNWFDHKWLNYSGTSVEHLYMGGYNQNLVLENKWQEKVTLPPFHPNRIISQKLFNNNMKEIGYINLHKRQMSNENLHNRVSNYTNNGMFIWYSSNSAINEKGSLMIYTIQNAEVESFYVQIEKKEKWQITTCKGISINHFDTILQSKN